MRRLLMASSALLLASTIVSTAATVEYKGVEDGVNIVALTGEIVEGDSKQFNRVTANLTGRTIVFLESQGGLVGESLGIGEQIHHSGYFTAVTANSICASGCGLIWLAGSTRLLNEGSKIGFHAAYRPDMTESGQTNAVIGAYLTSLGFSIPAIMLITESAPTAMKWLHPADAARVGITYSLVHQAETETFVPSSTASTAPNVPLPPIVTAPVAPTAAPIASPTLSPIEQQAVRLVMGYNAYWSQGGTNVEGLARYYAPQVTYYNTSIPVEKVMVEKRKFSARWPVRHYTVDPSSLFVQCDNGACSVTGIVAWDCISQERGEHSVGNANFVLRVVNGVIASENGAVLTAHKDTVGVAPQANITGPSTDQQAASMTTAYAEGRQARMQYEHWFTTLPEGLFQEGAEYWVNNRSDKETPPSCSDEDDTTWQSGCTTARNILAPIDFRRHTEKNYWWGWNSL